MSDKLTRKKRAKLFRLQDNSIEVLFEGGYHQVLSVSLTSWSYPDQGTNERFGKYVADVPQAVVDFLNKEFRS